MMNEAPQKPIFPAFEALFLFNQLRNMPELVFWYADSILVNADSISLIPDSILVSSDSIWPIPDSISILLEIPGVQMNESRAMEAVFSRLESISSETESI